MKHRSYELKGIVSMRMIQPRAHPALRVLVAIAALITTLVFVAPTPAHADSGWRCTSLTNGDLCLQTLRKDSSHIRGVDIKYNRRSGGCIQARFGHRIVASDGNIKGSWWDDGTFTLCPTNTASYFWNHAGAGAYIESGYVQGWMDVREPAEGYHWTKRIPKAEI